MIGEKIAEARRSRGMTLGDLGKAIGTSRQAVCNWESNRSIPTDVYKKRLHDVLGLPFEIFFEGRSTGERQENLP